MAKKVLIVGSGIAGLATSIRLAINGYDVTVFEANTYPGGKLSEISQDGYRFDAGPSLLATPQMIDELFELAGKKPQDYFTYKKLDKSCLYFYPDGTQFTAFSNRDLFVKELQTKFNINNPNKVLAFLNKAKFNYNLTAPIFLEQSLHKIKNYLNLKTVKGVLNAWRLNLFTTMFKVNHQTFKHPKLEQYFNRYATYNGSNPYAAPGLLNVIAHLEHYYGTFIPNGGMHAITQSLYKLAKELGVQFNFNATVQEIVYSDGANPIIEGVKVNNTFFASNVVVSNMDIYHTYRKLLPNLSAPEKILAQEKSSSALIFYWGIKQEFLQLDLHNIFFTNDYKTEFDFIFNKKQVFADPTVYVNITSKYNKADAPNGCENWFVMINVPNNSGQQWDEVIAQCRENILAKLSSMLGQPIKPLIQTELVLDPRSIEAKTGSYLGALYGNASNNRYAAFFRHKNFSSQVKGLYFCGGSVHPGGGIPLCLNSAKIVAQLIKEDFN